MIAPVQVNGLVQEGRNSIANALELRLSCTKPSKFSNPEDYGLLNHMNPLRTPHITITKHITGIKGHKGDCPGLCITTVAWWWCKTFSQWEGSFYRKLHCHWLKGLRQRQNAVMIQSPGGHWRCSSLPSTFAVGTRAVILMTFPFKCLP